MKKLSKEEAELVDAMVSTILSGRAQEFVILVKAEQGQEYAFISEGAKTLLGRCYREFSKS